MGREKVEDTHKNEFEGKRYREEDQAAVMNDADKVIELMNAYGSLIRGSCVVRYADMAVHLGKITVRGERWPQRTGLAHCGSRPFFRAFSAR